MLDGMSDSIQRSRIENLHSREVDNQSPTGLILVIIVIVVIIIIIRLKTLHISTSPLSN